MKHVRNIISVTLSNVIGFGSSFIIGFILPAFLTVSDYGHYRQFMLYTSFVYILNFGYGDGVYIKYGGVNKIEIDRKKISLEYKFILGFQFVIMLVLLVASLLFNNIMLAIYAAVIFLININTFHENLLQAIGEFSFYSRSNIIKSIIYIASLIFTITVLRSKNYFIFITLYVGSFFFSFCVYQVFFKKYFYEKTNPFVKADLSLFKVGIYILLANMSLTFVANIGNWVVNFGFSINEFAQYSFQNSLLNVILLIVNAIGLVFYNVISNNKDEKLLKKIKTVCIYLGVFSGLVFFVFKIIIIEFLSEYIPAITLLSITFVSIPYIMLSKILVANLYKVERSEKKYLKDSLVFAISSFLLVSFVSVISNKLECIAIATTLCYILWFLFCTRKEFIILKSDTNELLLLLSHSLVFFISANSQNIMIGIFIYLIYLFIVIYWSRMELKQLTNFIFGRS